jgi:hypothetical protein
MGYGGGGFFPLGIIFVILYIAVIVYFFVQLTGINKALQRIANVLEKKFPGE